MQKVLAKKIKKRKVRVTVMIPVEVKKAMDVYCSVVGQRKNVMVTESIVKFLKQNQKNITKSLSLVIRGIR